MKRLVKGINRKGINRKEIAAQRQLGVEAALRCHMVRQLTDKLAATLSSSALGIAP